MKRNKDAADVQAWGPKESEANEWKITILARLPSYSESMQKNKYKKVIRDNPRKKAHKVTKEMVRHIGNLGMPLDNLNQAPRRNDNQTRPPVRKEPRRQRSWWDPEDRSKER